MKLHVSLIGLEKRKREVAKTRNKEIFEEITFENFPVLKNWRGTWLARSMEHVTLDLEVVDSRPTLGVEIT